MLTRAHVRPRLPLVNLCLRCSMGYHGEASASRGSGGSGGGRDSFVRRRPAGLSLSQNVGKISTEQAPSRKSTALFPTGGLNQRVANIPEKRLRKEQAQRSVKPLEPGERAPKTPKPKPDFKHLKMARSLEPISRNQKTSLRIALKTDEIAAAFEEFPLLPAVIKGVMSDVLSDLTTIDPTPVQRLAIPKVLEQDILAPLKAPSTYLIAAETGSGKTLAYLLPTLHNIKRAEQDEAEANAAEQAHSDNLFTPEDFLHPKVAPPPRPRAVILLPTSELVAQVGSIAKKLSHEVKFRTALLSREFSPRSIKSQLDSRPDLIISTPHLLSSIAQADPGILEKCLVIVADEADSLLDKSFEEITQSIIVRAMNLQQLILCSATIPRALDNRIRAKYPDIHRLVTPNLHSIPRRVQMSIVDVEGNPYRGNKMLACADVLYGIAKDAGEEGFVKKVIVFVNERDDTGPLTQYLREKGIDAFHLTRDSEGRRSAEKALEYFCGPKEVDTNPPTEDPNAPPPSAKNKLHSKQPKEDVVQKVAYTPPVSAIIAGLSPADTTTASPSSTKPHIQRMKVLVTTDIASRGIDTKTVKTVMLYDVPFSTVDFIHRIGRTGRMGRRGKAIVLVDGKTNRAWVKEVKLAMHMGTGLV
ncbi:P-loop containing nucleoside triphosphate hydrolase protein [Peziza echinospora]|nr:P-loop containing nucleoside triphosphate hydrolase protein [Peziza echinospora]